MSKKHDLFLLFASVAPWWRESRFPRSVFQRLLEVELTPIRLGHEDPPRRDFEGIDDGERLWLNRGQAESASWVFVKAKGKAGRASTAVELSDVDSPAAAMRGDHHLLYMSVSTASPEKTIHLWNGLCRDLLPFHGLLDSYSLYEARSTRLLPDGSIEKPVGGYRRCLPGLFRFNFFGQAYLRLWADRTSELKDVPGTRTEATPNGLILETRQGDEAFAGPAVVPYGADEDRILGAIGPEFFFDPRSDGGLKSAPTPESLRAEVRDV